MEGERVYDIQFLLEQGLDSMPQEWVRELLEQHNAIAAERDALLKWYHDVPLAALRSLRTARPYQGSYREYFDWIDNLDVEPAEGERFTDVVRERDELRAYKKLIPQDALLAVSNELGAMSTERDELLAWKDDVISAMRAIVDPFASADEDLEATLKIERLLNANDGIRKMPDGSIGIGTPGYAGDVAPTQIREV